MSLDDIFLLLFLGFMASFTSQFRSSSGLAMGLALLEVVACILVIVFQVEGGECASKREKKEREREREI